jgi:hypothetical protein
LHRNGENNDPERGKGFNPCIQSDH